MQQAIHERRTDVLGIQAPIDCYRICSSSHRAALPHYHEYIEFIYADEDCCVDAWVAGQTVNIKKGDMLIINSNAAHTFFTVSAPSKYICIKAMPDVIYSSDNFFYDFKYVIPFFENNLISYQHFSADALEGAEIPTLFKSALNEQTAKDYGYEISLKSLVLRIFLWVVRYRYSIGISQTPESEDSYENSKLIQRSVEYINENYADVNEALAAELVNMSYSHYSRQFKKAMGKSFCEYLTVTRINAAERLLLTTSMSVTDIALSTGFATSSHFIEKFKKLKGITPSKYRQIWVKKEN
ncbi:MAG: helix-turn-helix transcriptional regulator [Clostridia bacterium]|nr:helix-turn-helix transcriptional regulator [Clostridia bacterium]